MKCPRDGSVLQHVELAGIELDKCHQCDGLWFDHRELDQLRDAHLAKPEEQVELAYGNPQVEAGKTKGYMRCPRCDDGRLQAITYTLEGRVKIDRCEKCLGFWLDDKELNAIVGEKEKMDEEYAPSRLLSFLRGASRLWKSS